MTRTCSLRDFPTLNLVIGWVREDGDPPADPRAGAQAAPELASPDVPSAASAPAPAAGEDPLVAAVVQIVADMTGYPPELLDLDLDLEADLGVDTVKQAEVFAAVRERYNVERDPNLQLRDFPTLNLVIGWVREKTGIAAVVSGSAAAGAQAAPDLASPDVPAAASAPAATGAASGPAGRRRGADRGGHDRVPAGAAGSGSGPGGGPGGGHGQAGRGVRGGSCAL